MLIFLPDELIENSDVLQEYVHKFKTQLTFHSVQEQQTYALAEVETQEEQPSTPKSPTPLLTTTKSMIDAVNEPMLLVDENMKIIMVNPCCLELLGYTSTELENKQFPYPIMDRIIQGETNIAEAFPDVTCCKIELVGFQGMSGEMSALDIVQLLNACVGEFDDLAEEHSLVKIKSSGTDYLCVGGLHSHERDHAQHVIQFAIESMHAITEVSEQLSLRIGIHSGAVTAGVIGKHRQSYDVWGETVDCANRMCVMAPIEKSKK